MKSVRRLVVCAALFALVGVIAAADVDQDALSKESIAKCKETAATKATVAQIMEKINKGCKLIEAEGEAAFNKFKGKDTDFIFGGTYIWIHTPTKTEMVMHPIKYKMEGKELGHLRDKNGKAFFAEMNNICLSDGSGWVQYVWPKPGEKQVSTKVSFVKLAKHGDKQYVLGCGVYDMTVDDVNVELAKLEGQGKAVASN